jgi:hypothetical protein
MGTLQGDVCIFMTISRWSIRKMRNVLDKNCRENRNTDFCSITFFRKSCRLRYNVKKYNRVEHATDDSTAHAQCMLANYTHTFSLSIRICNTYCFSTATRTRLKLTLHVHCLSCLATWRTAVFLSVICSCKCLCAEPTFRQWVQLVVSG